MKERTSFLKNATVIARHLLLAYVVVFAWSASAEERATPLCNGLSGLPQLKISMDSLKACADMDEDTFEDPTHESYCRCQQKVFGLIRNSARPAELSKERALIVSSDVFKRGFEEHISIFSEINRYEGLYQLEGAESFNCHLARESKAIAESCGKSADLDSYLLRVLEDYDSESLAKTKGSQSAFDRLFSVQSMKMNELSGNRPFSCMSPTDGNNWIMAAFELLFDNSRALILENKDRFINSPSMALREIFTKLAADLPEAKDYVKFINAHPVVNLLDSDTEATRALVDWIEKNPETKLSEAFNPDSGSGLAKAQTNLFQKRCHESLSSISAGVSESVCGEKVFKIKPVEPTYFSKFAHDEQIENGLLRAEAFAELYCREEVAGDKSENKFEIEIESEKATGLSGITSDMASESVCSSVCAKESQDGANCELHSYDDLAQKVKSSECSASIFSCLEIKALVRVYEREEQTKKSRLARGAGPSESVTTFSKILVDQGVSQDVVTYAGSPSSSRRVEATKPSRGNSNFEQSENISARAPLKPTEVKVDQSGDKAFQDSLDALGSLAAKKKDQIELGPESYASNTKTEARSATSDLVADIQARKRDQEIKKLRSAIADLEEMGGKTREDISSITNPQIPYRRANQMGEDLGGNENFDSLAYAPKYNPRVAQNSRIPFPDYGQDAYRPVDPNFVKRDQASVNPTPGPETQASVSNTPGTSGPGAALVEGSAPSRAPASVAVTASSASGTSEAATAKLSFAASELDTLSSEKILRAGLQDKEEFLLEVVMSSGQKSVLIPVVKRTDKSGKAMWEPRMTDDNRDYFERVLEIPLFKEFKRDLIEKHFNSSSAN